MNENQQNLFTTQLTLKEKMDMMKGIKDIMQENCDYREFMDWSCKKTELLCSRIRAIALPKITYQFYGQEWR